MVLSSVAGGHGFEHTGDLTTARTAVVSIRPVAAALALLCVPSEEAEEATGWGVEISLDIQVAHATCQSCDILLVESNTPGDKDLETAEKSAATFGAGEISNSWAGPEAGETPNSRASARSTIPAS